METQTDQKLEQGPHCGSKPQSSDVTRRTYGSVVGPGLCTCEGPKTVIHSARVDDLESTISWRTLRRSVLMAGLTGLDLGTGLPIGDS